MMIMLVMITEVGRNMTRNVGETLTTNVCTNMTTHVGINMTTNVGLNMTTDSGIDMTTNVVSNMNTNVGINFGGIRRVSKNIYFERCPPQFLILTWFAVTLSAVCYLLSAICLVGVRKRF